jgi:hypothetical protein
MHKNATKCNKTLSKWCENKDGASKIIDTFETYQWALEGPTPWGGAAKGGAAPAPGVAGSWLVSVSPLDSVFVSDKYALWLLFRPITRIFPLVKTWNRKIAKNRN